MALKKITKITNKQIAEKGVQALADRPNLTAQYGASGLSAAQLKLWFDKLATFLAERINEISDSFSSDEATNYIRVCLDDYGVDNLGALITAFTDGDFAAKILKLSPSAGSTQKQALQAIINNVAKQVSDMQENKVEKTKQPNQLYGTDGEGKATFYPATIKGTQVLAGGQILKEFDADAKYDKAGGTISGDVAIQGNLSVAGKTTTQDTETVQAESNILVTNKNGVDLIDLGGFAVKTDTVNAYGIMYDPVGDGVKIGLGTFDENGKFTFLDGEAQFLATRADEIADGNLVQWDGEKRMFVDSGVSLASKADKTDLPEVLRW